MLLVGYGNRSNMERLLQEMEDPSVRQILAKATHEALGISLEVKPILLQQTEISQQGHLVRSAQRFGGRIISQEDITPAGEET